MRKLLALAGTLMLLGTACAGGSGADKTIFVDFSHDEFASFFIANFPRQVRVRQGDELLFKQTWTGEPHSVTGGTLANELMEEVRPFLDRLHAGKEVPDEPPKNVMKLEKKLVWAFGEEDDLNQTAAQPCFLEKGEPPKNGKPCRTQDQPAFDGTHSFYNSGLIPYEGPQGNEYRVKLTEDIDPGSYWFYCNVHGEFQSTEVVVAGRDAEVPSAQEIGREARKEIEEMAEPLLRVFREATDEGRVTLRDPQSRKRRVIEGNFAGLFTPEQQEGAVNEFVPRRLEVEAGDPITWNMLGSHTISFGVPEYFPIITFDEDGTVERNKMLDPPAGGAKELDLPEDERFDEDRAKAVRFDAGNYDGSGFWSSGTIDAEPWLEYTMRITKPGTYRYACLIHPPMVGTVEVT